MLRTPPTRFEGLPDYDFAPHWTGVSAGDGAMARVPMRMHHVEQGPADGPVVLMLHGEPSWSYLYRHMVPAFAREGFRAIAPDLIGFGRSDKPTHRSAYTYQAHVDWVRDWFDAHQLTDVTLVCQDWGSLIGLRLVGELPERFARVVVANGFLPTAERGTPLAFDLWQAASRFSPVFPAGRIVALGTKRPLSRGERAAYDAPFGNRASQAGARVFPSLVPTEESDPAVPANREAWRVLGQWDKPFLTLFGCHDPILGRADRPLQQHVPGAAGQPHGRLDGSHFVQEDCGLEIVERTVSWIRGSGPV
ncbi:haloalkane dehalogenase [Nocardioidaceae bacterium]|nr:haloalkane dehalogenase [Nocardioidaceae bacterium]